MNPFAKISGENLHHAYLVVGRPAADVAVFESVPADVAGALRMSLQTSNPDAQRIVCDTLTVDLARKIITDAGLKSFNGGKKFFLIETNIITEEAQNALLKVFEEPTDGTHFFILMPQDTLLPTLRSRMQIVQTEGSLPWSSPEGNLLDKSITEKLAMVKEITDGISDEEKTKQDAIVLLNQIESELYKKGAEKESRKLKLCQLTRSALYDRGAPVKMILENLMISI